MLDFNYNRNTKKIKTFQYIITLISILLISFGILRNQFFYTLIGIVIVINLPYLYHEKGIHLNKQTKSYQYYNTLLGLKFWKSKKNILYSFDYVSLNKAQKTIRNPFGLNRHPEIFFVYEINLFDYQGNYFTLCQIDIEDFENAKICSKKLADYFNTKLYDCTKNH